MALRKIIVAAAVAAGVLGCSQQTRSTTAGSARISSTSVPALGRAPQSPDTASLPEFGAYVYAEQLPEVLERVRPYYPAEARAAGIQGTVVVQALVRRDGSVADTRVMHSVPGLDATAMAVVRHWQFRPALAQGQPIAVWVAVPVKFTLN